MDAKKSGVKLLLVCEMHKRLADAKKDNVLLELVLFEKNNVADCLVTALLILELLSTPNKDINNITNVTFFIHNKCKKDTLWL